MSFSLDKVTKRKSEKGFWSHTLVYTVTCDSVVQKILNHIEYSWFIDQRKGCTFEYYRIKHSFLFTAIVKENFTMKPWRRFYQ